MTRTRSYVFLACGSVLSISAIVTAWGMTEAVRRVTTLTSDEMAKVEVGAVINFRCSLQTAPCPSTVAPFNSCVGQAAGNCGTAQCFSCSVTVNSYFLCVAFPKVYCTGWGGAPNCGFSKDAGCSWVGGIGCLCNPLPPTFSEDYCPARDCSS